MKPVAWYMEACPEETWTEPESFHSRGIGLEAHLPCLVTGMPIPDGLRFIPNISGFVTSKESGERVVAMFGGRARLDFRPHEPRWIQVKVGTLESHRLALELIDFGTRQRGKISHRLIHTALMHEAAVREDPASVTRLLPPEISARFA